jgi:hypothetical protein
MFVSRPASLWEENAPSPFLRRLFENGEAATIVLGNANTKDWNVQHRATLFYHASRCQKTKQ